jgi:hypothetical protein
MAEFQRQLAQSSLPQFAIVRGRAVQSIESTDPTLVRIINRTIGEARDAGCDHGGQTRKAVLAVRQVRPDIAAQDVVTLVHRIGE